jgi:hypothetical protein
MQHQARSLAAAILSGSAESFVPYLMEA